MLSLEELLRERAQKGELNYVSLAFTERGFEAAYMGVKRGDGAICAHYDPVCAIFKALTGKPGIEPPRPTKKPRQRTEKIAKPVTDDFEDLLA